MTAEFKCTVIDDANPNGVPLSQWGQPRTTDRGPVAWLPPDPPPECKSEAEKTAFAFGWFKALETQRLAKEEAIYETIIQWDEGGGKRSRRELARRIVALYANTGDTP